VLNATQQNKQWSVERSRRAQKGAEGGRREQKGAEQNNAPVLHTEQRPMRARAAATRPLNTPAATSESTSSYALTREDSRSLISRLRKQTTRDMAVPYQAGPHLFRSERHCRLPTSCRLFFNVRSSTGILSCAFPLAVVVARLRYCAHLLPRLLPPAVVPPTTRAIEDDWVRSAVVVTSIVVCPSSWGCV